MSFLYVGLCQFVVIYTIKFNKVCRKLFFSYKKYNVYRVHIMNIFMKKYFKLIQTAPKVIGIECLKSFLTLYINKTPPTPRLRGSF